MSIRILKLAASANELSPNLSVKDTDLALSFEAIQEHVAGYLRGHASERLSIRILKLAACAIDLPADLRAKEADRPLSFEAIQEHRAFEAGGSAIYAPQEAFLEIKLAKLGVDTNQAASNAAVKQPERPGVFAAFQIDIARDEGALNIDALFMDRRELIAAQE